MTKNEAEQTFAKIRQRGLSGWVEQVILKNDHGWIVVVSQKHNKQGEIGVIKPKRLMTIEEAIKFLADDMVVKL